MAYIDTVAGKERSAAADKEKPLSQNKLCEISLLYFSFDWQCRRSAQHLIVFLALLCTARRRKTNVAVFLTLARTEAVHQPQTRSTSVHRTRLNTRLLSLGNSGGFDNALTFEALDLAELPSFFERLAPS